MVSDSEGRVGGSNPEHTDALQISVVICTRDRAQYLARAIDSVLAHQTHSERFEIIVVDNGSTDNTKEVVGRCAGLGNVRYVFEGTVGLCQARNTGWRHARGRYVAYFDDDAVADCGWLEAIESAFASTPDAGVVGGRVDPIWEGDRPRWLSDEIALGLTILNWSSEPKVIRDTSMEWLVGANMAIPKSVLAEVGGFHPWLDRIGRRMLSSGDVFLQKQVIQRGYLCLYYPDMSVQHLVPKSRLRKRWFIRRYYSQGLSDFLMQLIEERPSKGRRALLALSKIRPLLMSPAKVLNLFLPTNNPHRFTQKCWTLIILGHIAGLLGAARR